MSEVGHSCHFDGLAMTSGLPPENMTAMRSATSTATPTSWGDEYHRHAELLLQLAQQ
jgi:hypothetical protein